MTKTDLLDWVHDKGCESEPANDHSPAIVLINPKNNCKFFFNTHRMDKIADPILICRVCTRLGIEVPNYGASASQMLDDLDNMDL